MTITITFVPLRRAGRLREGERDKGSLWHAVPFVPGLPLIVFGSSIRKALCGAQPAIQWSSEPGDAVTCPACLRKLAKIGA